MDKLNSKHLMFIIFGTMIVSIKTNINVFIRDSGRDAWLAMTIGSFIALFFALFITKVLLKNNEYNIVKIYETALGKVLGKIFLILLLFTFLLTLIESASTEASAMHTNLLIETPPWYLSMFFVIPAIYAVKKGIIPVIIITIIGVTFAAIAGINLVILTAKYKHYEYVLPVLYLGITKDFIISIIKCVGFYGSIMVLFPFFSYVEDKKRLKRDVAVALLLVIQMHIVSVAGAIAHFGADRVKNIVYPKLTQTQEISYFGFLESGEFFVMFQIIGGWFVKYILTFFVILKILQEMNIKNKYIVYIISLVVFIATYFASNNVVALTEYLNSYAYICLINYVIFPTIIFTISNFKNKKKTQKKRI